MATATYDLIASQTLASAASSITFSSIAASWTDLRLVLSNVIGTASGLDINLALNGDTTASNYSSTNLAGSGSAASSGSATSYRAINPAFSLGNTYPEFHTLDLFSYLGSTYKTMLITNSYDRNGAGGVARDVMLWRNTAAVTSVAVSTSSSTFAAGMTANLYGIKAA
jgi:hypothetical protein